MAFDASKPAIADNYSTGYTQSIRANFDYLNRWGEGDSITGTPVTNAKRYNATSDLFEYYTGSAWATLPLAYLPLSGGGTVGGTVNFSSVLQENGSRVWTAATFVPGDKANVAGQVFTAAISTSSGDITSAGKLFGGGGGGNGLRKITVSTADQSSMAAGDIWFKY